MSSTLIIGLGNPILTDDAVGWRVAQALRDILQENPAHFPTGTVEITEACVGGLSLAEMMVGYQRVIVVDAIMTRDGVPGSVYHLTLDDLPETLNTASAHDTNLITALAALRRFEADVPADDAIEIVAIEALDVLHFSEQCTPAVENSVPAAAHLVLEIVGKFQTGA
jgi:hydrogenase maturation protease